MKQSQFTTFVVPSIDGVIPLDPPPECIFCGGVAVTKVKWRLRYVASRRHLEEVTSFYMLPVQLCRNHKYYSGPLLFDGGLPTFALFLGLCISFSLSAIIAGIFIYEYFTLKNPAIPKGPAVFLAASAAIAILSAARLLFLQSKLQRFSLTIEETTNRGAPGTVLLSCNNIRPLYSQELNSALYHLRSDS